MEAPESTSRSRERLVVRNVDDERRLIRVVRRREGDVRIDTVELPPDEEETLTLPDGAGTVTVQLDGGDASVATTYDPDQHPALFTVRDGSVLVARA